MLANQFFILAKKMPKRLFFQKIISKKKNCQQKPRWPKLARPYLVLVSLFVFSYVIKLAGEINCNDISMFHNYLPNDKYKTINKLKHWVIFKDRQLNCKTESADDHRKLSISRLNSYLDVQRINSIFCLNSIYPSSNSGKRIVQKQKLFYFLWDVQHELKHASPRAITNGMVWKVKVYKFF